MHPESEYALSRGQYFADFITAPLAIVAALAWLAHVNGHVFSVPFVSAVIVGGFAWSLAEYLIHRFVFHGFDPYKRQHHLHHIGPAEFIGVSPAATLALFVIFGVALPAFLGPPVGVGLFVGTVAWYYAYMTLHALYHQTPGHPWLARLRANHDWHHARPRVNFGVSTPLWDILFDTYARPLRR